MASKKDFKNIGIDKETGRFIWSTNIKPTDLSDKTDVVSSTYTFLGSLVCRGLQPSSFSKTHVSFEDLLTGERYCVNVSAFNKWFFKQMNHGFVTGKFGFESCYGRLGLTLII